MIKSELSLAANKLSHEYYHYNEFIVWPLRIRIIPRFYVSTSKSIIKALINMHSFEIQLSPIG
ncbi:TPA: hypothetical protein HNC60_12925 [Escherichia coli]|nr:hypothetical protein [Escherichia coli]MDD9833665.1 hypothetical protein [Escherichia coli]RXO89257.1 hypothetical protein D9K59_06185 [Escherichia coli]HAJ6504424.1 hypothetical protein [Escherichia coli]HAJ6918426.1 hypothetical protein [Escherichia coli]